MSKGFSHVERMNSKLTEGQKNTYRCSEVTDMSYWECVAEIDASNFVLSQMLEEVNHRLPIERMIDQSTGFDKYRLTEAEAIIERVKLLKKRVEELS